MSPTICVVDDDEATREILRRSLEQDGWSVLEAEHGADALQKLAHEQPAAIILDLMMPVMDGFEFLSNYSQLAEWLSVPVIAAAAQWLFKSGASSITCAIREGRHHNSPNGGFPEAAFAGALQITLGGPDSYGGTRVDKPVIGAGNPPPQTHHIPRACSLLLLPSAIWVLLSWGVQNLLRIAV